MNLKSLFLLLFVLSSCCPQTLRVETRYYSWEDLASRQVGTPDYRLQDPPFGQKIIVHWNIDEPLDEAEIVIKIRYTNREFDELSIPITKCKGSYIYKILNCDYLGKGKILSYKVELWNGNELIECKKHALWVELITFDIVE